jgi:AcrR family transcriptional regulator
MAMTTKVAPASRASARERLLASANELFYGEGIQSVGIDRVIEHAGVAKASLYNTFGSKDELIKAYLELRHARMVDRITRAMVPYDTPRERLLAIFDAQAELFVEPGFHGCAFASASAETRPGSTVEAAADAYRAFIRGLFVALAQRAGVVGADALGRQLHLLYDGAGLSARMDRDPSAAGAARAAAATLLDAALVLSPAPAPAPTPAPARANAAKAAKTAKAAKAARRRTARP